MNEPWEPRSGSLVTERNLVHEPLSKYLYQEYKYVTGRFSFLKKGIWEGVRRMAEVQL